MFICFTPPYPGGHSLVMADLSSWSVGGGLCHHRLPIYWCAHMFTVSCHGHVRYILINKFVHSSKLTTCNSALGLMYRTSKLLPKKLNLIDKHYNSPQFSFLLAILAALLLPCLCRQQLSWKKPSEPLVTVQRALTVSDQGLRRLCLSSTKKSKGPEVDNKVNLTELDQQN